MSIEKVRDFFGIKYVIPYNLTTHKPLVVLRVIGEISYENDVERVDLVGGHVEAPHDVEYGQPTPVLTGTVREYPPELFQIMETTTVTENTAETSGTVGTSTNSGGTSVFNDTDGINNVTGNPSLLTSLIFGEYIWVATAAQTLDLHINGLTTAFLGITGQVVASIDCSSSGAVQVDAAGVVLTVVGTAAFETGDTMITEVRPVNTGNTIVLVGAGTAPSTFGVRCIFPRKTDGVLHYIDVFNVSARGMSWKGVSREFSEFDFNWSPLARASDGAVYQMVRVLGA